MRSTFRTFPRFDRECRDLKSVPAHTPTRPKAGTCAPAQYASVVRRKCRIYRQSQTNTLLWEIRSQPRDFWREHNGKPATLPLGAPTTEQVAAIHGGLVCPLPHRYPHHPHRPWLALSNWHLALTTQSPQGRCERLCPSSTMASHAPSLDGLQNCCNMLTKRSQWRMARSAS